MESFSPLLISPFPCGSKPFSSGSHDAFGHQSSPEVNQVLGGGGGALNPSVGRLGPCSLLGVGHSRPRGVGWRQETDPLPQGDSHTFLQPDDAGAGSPGAVSCCRWVLNPSGQARSSQPLVRWEGGGAPDDVGWGDRPPPLGRDSHIVLQPDAFGQGSSPEVNLVHVGLESIGGQARSSQPLRGCGAFRTTRGGV